jgi:alpha-L-arabinofuranosidase
MDEHYYETADWFRQHAYRYDNYRRDTNTKVFLGEYASKGNAWYNALSEAAFMTGLERNADVVRMASYAPMFAKYGNTQWSAADMIWFNNSDYVLTPNYYVQSLFSNNQGNYSLPTEVKLNGIEKDDALKGGVAVGSWGTHNEFKDIEVKTENSTVTADKSEWETTNGDWYIDDNGVISQMSDNTGAVCYYASPDMRNYTLSLKARKLSGGEGFQIGVAADDALNYYRVNIGGWGNTTAKVQHIVNGVSSSSGNVAEQSYVGNVHINDNEWYDVTVEVTDDEIKAYLNDEFICSYKKPKEYGPVYSSSVYDEETGDVIVKVVNTMDSDVNIGMNVSGETVTSNIAKTTVMSGDTNLENSLDNKNAIVPKEIELTNASNNFTYNAPADSFSIIRLKTGNGGSKAYISGYEDGTFRPDNTITRAEAAAIIARCSADFDENKTYSSNFTDVSGDEWYANYVGYATEKGYISGYDGGPFKADIDITRGELAVILSKYGSFDGDGICTEFSDVPNDYYATGYIKSLYDENIVSGYEDGTFKPDNSVTRAEAVTMMNKVLGNPIAENAENPFGDVSPNHWAYNQIMTAVQGK